MIKTKSRMASGGHVVYMEMRNASTFRILAGKSELKSSKQMEK
jgi:hypothetical protein